MIKLARVVTVLLLTLVLAAGFALYALQPSWWTRQMEFTSQHDAYSSSTIVLSAPDTWFNLFVLIVATSLIVYFAVVGAGRLRRGRRLRDCRARIDSE